MKCVSFISCSCHMMIIHVSPVKMPFLVTLNHDFEGPMFRTVFD